MSRRFQFSLSRMLGNITLLGLALMLVRLGLDHNESPALPLVLAGFVLFICVGDLFGKAHWGALAAVVGWVLLCLVLFVGEISLR